VNTAPELNVIALASAALSWFALVAQVMLPEMLPVAPVPSKINSV